MNSTKPVIFLAFANEQDNQAHYLRALPEEVRSLRCALEQAEAQGLCQLEERTNATLSDIRDVFRKYDNRITVFHFGGHADSYRLLFEGEGGQAAEIDAKGFAGFLAEQAGLQLVFLNACSTAGQVMALQAAGVPVVIATSQAIPDTVATAFANEFYRSLATGTNSVSKAFAEATALVKAAHGGEARHLRPLGESRVASEQTLWSLYTTPGAAENAEWSLQFAANDPLFGLPPLPKLDLPETPYRHLEWFRKEDAEIFFGRSREIAELYQRVMAPDGDPIILFYGQSGVGKSSVLAAGLLPRLEQKQLVVYERREHDKGLAATLANMLHGANTDNLDEAWRTFEEQTGKPITLILDQVEEIFTRPNPERPDEMTHLLNALTTIFAARDRRPRGRLILSFRKEWLAEIEARLQERRLPRTKIFLERLNRNGVIDVITGPARTLRLCNRYGLNVADDLPGLIADDLLADLGSPVAPMLQILLTRMWEAAFKKDYDHPCFDQPLYAELRAQGLGLEDFLERQLAVLRDKHLQTVDSGLALDLLAYHTTPLGTSEQRTLADVQQTYRHQAAVLPELMLECRELYLLVDPSVNQPHQPPASRLTHDTLAPRVRKRFDESDAPGQRARRILENRGVDWKDGKEGTPLDEFDLTLVEVGLSGMRHPTPDEERLFEKSRAEQIRKNLERQAAAEREQTLRDERIAAEAREKEGQRLRRTIRADQLTANALKVVAHNPPLALLLAAEGLRAQNDFKQTYTTTSISYDFEKKQYFTENQEVTAGETVVSSAQSNMHELLARIGGILLASQGSTLSAVAFSPDGRWLAMTHNNAIQLWDIAAAYPYVHSEFPIGHGSTIGSLAYRSDGRWLATGDESSVVRLWNMAAPDPFSNSVNLESHGATVKSVTFSPNGHWFVTVHTDAVADLWNLAADAPWVERKALAIINDISSLAFSPDGRWLFTAHKDATIRRWDLSATNLRSELFFTGKGELKITSLVFSSDNRWLVAMPGHTINNDTMLWDLTGLKSSPITITSRESDVVSLSFSPDCHWLAIAHENINLPMFLLDTYGTYSVRLWDITTTDPAASPLILIDRADPVWSVAFSPDSRWLATAHENATVQLWDMTQEDLHKSPTVLIGHESAINSVAFSPNGRWLIATASDGSTRMWDMFTPSGSIDPIILSTQWNGTRSVTFSPDSHWLATAPDDNAYLWQFTDFVPSAEPIPLKGHQDTVNAVAFSPDGHWLATGSDDNTIRLQDIVNPTAPPIVLTGHMGEIRAMSFSPDGHWLASGAQDNTVRLWDMTATDPSADPITLDDKAGVWSVAFSPDGHWLASVDENDTVLLRDMTRVDSGGNPIPFRSSIPSISSGNIQFIAFSPDSRWLVTAPGSIFDILEMSDPLDPTPTNVTVQLWDISTPDPWINPVILPGHEDFLRATAFSPDGRWLITRTDNITRLWTWQVEDLIDLACRMAGRNLSYEEWQRYFPNEPYRKTCDRWPIHPTVPTTHLEKSDDHIRE